MRLLLDTHFVIQLLENRSSRKSGLLQGVYGGENVVHVSVVSLWEANIKSQLGKLPVRTPVADWPSLLNAVAIPLLAIESRHVLARVEPIPATLDPFDQLLLGICVSDDLKLVTRDRVLLEHPLAWRAIPERNK